MKTRILFFVLFTLLTTSLVTVTSAETNLGFFGLGARVGFVKPEDIDGTFGLGLQVKLGTIIPALALEVFADYWSKSYDVGVGDASLSDIGIGAMVKYYFETKSNVKPYVGGGLGMQFISSKVDMPAIPPFYSGGEVSTSQSDIGIHLAGGMELPLADKLDGVAEFKYVLSDGNYLGIFGGIIYKFGK